MSFELRLQGLMHPKDVNIDELIDIFTDLKDSIYLIAAKDFPEVDPQALGIGLSDVEDGSARYIFTSLLPAAVIAFSTIADAVHTRDFRHIPSKAAEKILHLSKFAQKRQCDMEFLSEGRQLARIRQTEPLQIEEIVYITGSDYLYGLVTQVGGADEPTVRLRLHTGDLFTCQITGRRRDKIALAKQLANRLYEEVALHGTAKWYADTMELAVFQVHALLSYKETTPTEAIQRLKEAVGGAYDDVEDVVEYFDQLRYGEEEQYA